jgi:hypothetical protein
MKKNSDQFVLKAFIQSQFFFGFWIFSFFSFFSFLAFLVVKVFEGGKRFPPIAFLLTVTDDA